MVLWKGCRAESHGFGKQPVNTAGLDDILQTQGVHEAEIIAISSALENVGKVKT